MASEFGAEPNELMQISLSGGLTLWAAGLSQQFPVTSIMSQPNPFFAPEFSWFIPPSAPRPALFPFQSTGSHSIKRMAHLLPLICMTCPAQAQFFRLISLQCRPQVCSRINAVFLQLSTTPQLASFHSPLGRSKVPFQVLSETPSFCPLYIINGKKHCLYTSFSSDRGSLLLRMSEFLQPTPHLFCIQFPFHD